VVCVQVVDRFPGNCGGAPEDISTFSELDTPFDTTLLPGKEKDQKEMEPSGDGTERQTL
jgi:hypothetical protein